MATWLSDELKDEAFAATFAEEAFVEDTINAICEWMAKEGISRAALAERLGVSKAHITQTLSGRNVSLRTIARMVHALRGVPTFSIRPPRSQTVIRVDPHPWQTSCAQDGSAYRLTGALKEAA